MRPLNVPDHMLEGSSNKKAGDWTVSVKGEGRVEEG